ncbi:MAG TPA: pyridine nucleotide-disulfide oxidoreductase [Clostridiaceae bacterium]|mgnify:CR=1 FL=1|nr:pyridine nucleotide-disulfide oxidoreductase [Clostridiaceae bacterium]
MHRDLVIIGGGPAGLAAAIKAREEGIDDILVIERDIELGGILKQCIHNGFGLHIFGEQLTGPEYAQKFIDKLLELGIEYKCDTMVLNITDNKKVTAVNTKDGVIEIQAKAIILSMGCRERPRGALNIPGSRPAGIFTAGTAQRFVNMEGYKIGEKIVILGSGDIGLIMARRLTLEGSQVKMVLEIMPYSSGLKRNIVQCLDDFGIPLLLNHTVVNIHGKERVGGVTIAKVDANRKPIPETFRYVECDTLLLSVGLIPENELSKNAGIVLDKVTGGPRVNESMETSVEGIFACGNVVQVHDLVDNVTKESYLAGLGAAKYIKGTAGNGGREIETYGRNGVRYVVPQKIRLDDMDDEVNLFLRVDNIYKDVYLSVSDGGKTIYKVKKRIVAPGEMESVRLKKDSILNMENDKLFVELIR